MDGNPKNDFAPRGLDDAAHAIPTAAGWHGPRVGESDGPSAHPAPIVYEDDSDEMWDEVMRNLGVDPATGGPLHPPDPLDVIPPEMSERVAREMKAFLDKIPPFNPPKDTDGRGHLLPLTEEERRIRDEEGSRKLANLINIKDETDTDEIWDQIFRNLGVDPTAGRPPEA